MRQWTVATAVGLVIGVSGVVGAHGNKPGEASITLGEGKVVVRYVGPAAKGRDVLSLIEPGNYWRMGADQATSLETEVDLEIGGQRVPKGSYTLVAHYDADGKWAIVVADGVGQGWRPEKEVARAPATVESLSEPVENMRIRLEPKGDDAADLVLEWGTSRLTARIGLAS